ncbi:MAG TPA: glycosyltransferase family 4 protein [Rudaea sp.]
MTLPRGLRYFSPVDVSGYGQAAIANVRAFVNAGIPVQWIPLDWHPEGMRPGQWSLPDGRVRAILAQCGEHGNLADLRQLVAATNAPVAHDTVIAHAPPESWPGRFERGKRNVGCTAWEPDRIPAHWLPLLQHADRIVVPSTQNRDTFLRSGAGRPVFAVPHVRRHRWCEFSPSDLAAAREDLGIPPGHRVFYTINAWDPRKAMPDLLTAFANAFGAGDPVTLLVKTRPVGYDGGPLYAERPTRDLATHVLTVLARALGRALPHVVLHDEEIDADALDLIHALGDVYVSLSRGEGWGLGAFEAATLGKPVIMTGWGGQTDFLGTGWPGAVPYQLAPCVLWPPYKPSYFPSQRWAIPHLPSAAALMRRTFADPQPAQTAAWAIRERIVREFAEPIVLRAWLEALDG